MGVWVPLTRDAAGTRHLTVENVVSRSNQADGINLHGKVTGAVVTNAHFENTGDDVFAVWAGDRELTEVELGLTHESTHLSQLKSNLDSSHIF